MATNQTIQFKTPLETIQWLDAAFRSEQRKYEQCPVQQDLVPGYVVANAWGYVVAGYFLIEEAFKALLYIRGIQVPPKHSLTMLFDRFKSDDKDILREYYLDFRASVGGNRASFPFATLDDFLSNLDGDQNRRGTDHVGSFDWRYFLIEKSQSQDMPVVSIDYLHEMAYGCIEIAKSVHFGNVDPLQFTHSMRMRAERGTKHISWLTKRINSDGWSELPDRFEILWGPDYCGRYDLLQFNKGSIIGITFSVLPANSPLPIIDKRQEVEAFVVQHE